MMARSFVDLVFIILCAVIVLLTESVQLQGLDAAPAGVGDEAAHEVALDEMEVIVVADDWYGCAGERALSVDGALRLAPRDAAILVVPESSAVSHHRVIGAWWDIRSRGRVVELGVESASDEGGLK